MSRGGETIALDRPDDHGSNSHVTLTVLSGPHRGQRWTFDRPTRLTVGRGEPANIRLGKESALSKCHCELNIDPPTVHLSDLKSTNGTSVNGVRVTEAVLSAGDQFGVGETSIAVEVLARPSLAVDTAPQQRDGGQVTLATGNTERAPEETVAKTPLPRTFGPYELGRKVGQGGMAIVYAGRHRKTLQDVAIKVIRSSVAPSEKMVQLFVREASLMLQLRHPRIVRCIEFGFQGNQPFLVMEWIETIDLLGLIDSQSPDRRLRMAAWVISRVLQALGHAHLSGIVHRDVKPGNILAYREGRHLQLKLADFGLAKCYEDAGFSALTDDLSVRGTLAYMAPEQMKDARTVGPPADIFAAGSCLYRFVAGQHPLVTPDGIVCDRDVLAAAGVPEALQRIISRAMRWEAEDRYRDAAAMARALQPFHGKPN